MFKKRYRQIILRRNIVFVTMLFICTVGSYIYLSILNNENIISDKYNFNYVFDNFTERKKPLAKIILYSSGATYDLVEFASKTWANHPLVRDGTFEVNVAISYDAKITKKYFRTLQFPCTDRVEKPSGLACRVDLSFFDFLQDVWSADWIFKAMDDTWLQLDNLYTYITNLNTFIDPKKNLVVKAHVNSKHLPDYLIHGGTGWLQSRAMTEYLFKNHLNILSLFTKSYILQDDTTQSLINYLVFDRHFDYHETCYLCQRFTKEFEPCFENYNFSTVPECPSNYLVADIKSVISVHLFGDDPLIRTFANNIDKLPDDLCYYYIIHNTYTHLCRKTPTTIIANYDIEHLKLNTPILTMNHTHKPAPLKRPFYYSSIDPQRIK